ncbi:hypothetical protein PRIPAC_70339 [Pristionchus pacificus]|uniref:Uncharacterized protein n=1 Tax=Pristionchus pacificus TaxID=54126 RepID=A0A454XK94_PRIPA|nr:hypothetical protein PRIPAC_70339 [Pristionchus pacificus]|eukprot:PDM71369.1 hypothetical protein PRIPAC_37776 [Pristionchus pacificus]
MDQEELDDRTAKVLIRIAIEIYAIGRAMKKDYDNGTKHHTAYVLSDLIGETVGAYYGYEWGAAVASELMGDGLGKSFGKIIGASIGAHLGAWKARKAIEVFFPEP